jgi:hypothetical protein
MCSLKQGFTSLSISRRLKDAGFVIKSDPTLLTQGFQPLIHGVQQFIKAAQILY